MISILVLALFMAEISFPVIGAARAEAAWSGLDGTAPRKEMEVVLEDEQLIDNNKDNKETMRMANVLVMVEATAGMQFSPTTAMPTVVLDGGSTADRNWTESENDGADWKATLAVYKRKPDDVIRMMAGATFGIGAMPVAWTGINLEPGRNLYGRDLDTSNNYPNRGKAANLEEFMKLYRNDYYFPFKDTNGGIPTGYSYQTNGLEIGYSPWGYGIKPSSVSHYNLEDYEVGTRILAGYTYTGLTATKFPYALVFKDPQYWVNGWTKSSPPTQADLVPNDSRLYQAKLVLWNLMENRDMWANVRFGLASTFLPHTNDSTAVKTGKTSPYGHTGTGNRYDFSGMYKVSPFGNNAWTFSTFNADGTIKQQNKKPASKTDTAGRRQFVNGVLVQSISGNIRGHNALHAQMYPMSQHMTNELVYSRITKAFYSKHDDAEDMKAMYKAFHRASLLVPIREYDDKWTWSGRQTMTQAARFKLWIDGFADIANGKVSSMTSANSSGSSATNKANRSMLWHYYKNPEIGVAGVFVLPHAIYPDPRTAYGMSRADYLKNVKTAGHTSSKVSDAASVWYSNKSYNTDYKFKEFPSSTGLENPESEAKVYFNGGSGEAVGSVLDFFSPPTENYSSLIPAQYPIRSACENNWVILITTGQEVKPVDGASYEYTAAQAIKNLYDATNKETATKPRATTTGRLDGSKIYAKYEKASMLVRDAKGNVSTNSSPNPRKIDLDNPIRTLVIGMIPDPSSISDPAVKAEVKDMKLNLTRMAVAGWGGNPDSVTEANMNDADRQPYLAYDTETLTKAISAAITVINDSSMMQPAKGVVAQAKAISGLTDDTSELFTYKYKIMRSNQWDVELKRYEAKTNENGQLVLEYQWEMGRRVNSADRRLEYWKAPGLPLASLAEGDSNFAALTGVGSGSIEPPSGTDFDKLSPSDALIKWFKGSDVSYFHMNSIDKPKTYDRSYLLTDFGQGGLVAVQDPTKGADFLPGFREWAEKTPQQESVLYGQTNDGILHVINQETGRERRAILPPPSLVPGRLAVLTTHPASVMGGKRQWIDILWPESGGGQRSFPAYILDGALQKRDFDLRQTGNENGWGSYLVAALGRGGSGLYALDVTDHDGPELMWYKEKVGSQLAKADVGGSAFTAAVPGGADPDSAFMKLGFNSPKPALGVAVTKESTEQEPADFKNFIAMAGGAQRELDLQHNGDEGAVFLMIDPKDGGVIASFDSASVEDAGGLWRNGAGTVGAKPYMGMMVSEPTLVRSGSSASERNYLTGRVLTADNRGNIFSVNMEDDNGKPLVPNEWKIRTVASLSRANAGAADSHSIPHGLVTGSSHGYSWAAGGTADIQLIKSATDPDEDGFLKNADQLMFAFKLLKKRDQSGLFSRENDFKRLDTEIPDNVYNPNATNQSGDAAYSGWYASLRTGGANTFDEYVSTKPVIVNGTLYVATFTRMNKTGNYDSDVCGTTRLIDGDSRLFAVDVATGGGNTWAPEGGKTPKYVEFKGAKIVSLTLMREGGRDKLLVSFDILNAARYNMEANKDRQKGRIGDVYHSGDYDSSTGGTGGLEKSEDEATIDTPPGGGGGGGNNNFPTSADITQYWVKY
ncbi:MAG: hypothetical protein LBL73_04590 [Synergistaceae bacterium]|nr:hypothetical protein [Synergistaceae bacterium]